MNSPGKTSVVASPLQSGESSRLITLIDRLEQAVKPLIDINQVVVLEHFVLVKQRLM